MRAQGPLGTVTAVLLLVVTMGAQPAPTAPVSTSSTEAAAELPVTAFTPAQIRSAYNDGSLFYWGARGQGTTVVIPGLFDGERTPRGIAQDFAAFSALNGLRAGGLSFRYFGLGGQDLNGSAINGPSEWGPEEVLDAEAVHGVAPRAQIVVLLALNDVQLYRGISLAVNQSWGNIFSFSNGFSDGSAAMADGVYALNSTLELAAHKGINFFVASGDCGADQNESVFTTSFPASSPWTISVGGTVLRTTASGRWLGEYGWNGTGGGAGNCTNQGGSGGGFGPLGNMVPLVAALGGSWMRIVLDSFQFATGGTSLASPIWAGFVADLQSALHRPLGWLPPQLRAIGANTLDYSLAFHSITQGFNGYSCSTGQNPVTGFGSPKVSGLLSVLRSGVA